MTLAANCHHAMSLASYVHSSSAIPAATKQAQHCHCLLQHLPILQHMPQQLVKAAEVEWGVQWVEVQWVEAAGVEAAGVEAVAAEQL